MSKPKRRKIDSCRPAERFQPHVQEEFPRNVQEITEVEIDGIQFTVESLNTIEDCRLFFDIACSMLKRGNFDVLDNVATILERIGIQFGLRTCSKESLENDQIAQEINFFVSNVMKAYGKRLVDEHFVLRVLTLSDSFLIEQSEKQLDRNDVELLKLSLFSTTYQKKLEVFSCGCFQKEIVDLYMKNDRSRFAKLSDNLVRKCLKKEIISKKFDCWLNIETNPVKFFKLYSELICEMIAYGYIDINSDELWRIRIPHLMALLLEFPDSQFCTVCETLYSLFNSISNSTSSNKSNNNLTRICKRLFARVFEFIEKNGRIEIATFEKNELLKWEEAVRSGNFSHLSNSDVFLPLHLVESVVKASTLWESLQPVLVQNLAKTKVDSPHFFLFCIYILRFSFTRKDDSEDIINGLTKFLNLNYQNATINQKEMILFVIDLMENLRLQPSSTSRTKQKLLLNSDTSDFITLQNLSEFSSSEINDYCDKFASSLTEPQWNKLFEILENSKEQVNAKLIWQNAIKNATKKVKEPRFIINQIKIMIGRKDKQSLKNRIDQIFSMFRETFKLDELQPVQFLLVFSETILYSDSNDLDPMLLNDFIPLLLVMFCCFYDNNEERIRNIFKKLVQKIEIQIEGSKVDIGQRISQNEEDVFKYIDRICEISVACFSRPSCCDVKKWAAFRASNSNNGETSFVEYLGNIPKKPELFKKLFKNEELYNNTKERVIRVFARVFSNLSVQLRLINETGRSAYCLFSIRAQTELKQLLSSNCRSMKWEQVAVDLLQGFSKCKKDWNLIFVRARVGNVLSAAESDQILYRKLVEIISSNEILTSLFPQFQV